MATTVKTISNSSRQSLRCSTTISPLSSQNDTTKTISTTSTNIPSPSSPSTDHDVIIIGGGIVGLACAAGLISRGITNIALYEKARSFRPIGAAIGLFPNGHRALDGLSPTVADKVKLSVLWNQTNVMKDATTGNVLREMSIDKGKVGGGGVVMPDYLVWYLLQQFLLEEIPPGVVHWGHALDSFSVDDDSGVVTARIVNRNNNDETNSNVATTEHRKTCRLLIGADGIRSTIRRQLFGPRDLIYHDKMMFRAVVTMSELPPSASCIIPPTGTAVAYQGREKGMLLAFRETAKGIATITAMKVFADEPTWSRDDDERKERLMEIFGGYPEEVLQLLECVNASSIHEDAVYSIEVLDEWSRGPVVILGDAAHAMTPGLGQGANQGLEDACELVHEIAGVLSDDNNGTSHHHLTKKSIPSALESFWQKRVDRVREVSDHSKDRTRQVNASNNKNAMSYDKNSNRSFMEGLYGWTPSYGGDKRDT